MTRTRRPGAVALAAAFGLVVAAIGSWGLQSPRHARALTTPAAAPAAPRPGGRPPSLPDGVPAAPVVGAVLSPAIGSLDALLDRAGYQLPDGTSVYVAEVMPGPGGVASYVPYEAGGGPYDASLWPASSVKVLAALGALRFLETLGFTGAAVVTTDEWSATVSDLYDQAIRDSSNDAYDALVAIAGVDWLNDEFLTPDNGFPETVIQRSYEYGDVISSPPMTISEGGRSVDLQGRTPEADLGVPDGGNRSNLAEMVDSVRRVTLDAELPPSQRLGLAPEDVAGISDALLGADGFLKPAVADTLGQDALVYDKPGWVSGESCLDVGLVVDRAVDRRFLVGIASPDDGTDCAAVPEIASVVLSSLAGP